MDARSWPKSPNSNEIQGLGCKTIKEGFKALTVESNSTILIRLYNP